MSTPHDTDSLDDAELWRRHLAGDPAALEVMHGRYGRRLLLFLKARCHPPLDYRDLAQTTWEHVCRQEAAWDPAKGKFSSWLFQIGANAKRDELRRRRRRPEQQWGEGYDPQTSGSADVSTESDAAQDCLQRLGGKFAEVLRLRINEGLDNQQIAERLGITIGTVYKYASQGGRGRAEMRGAKAVMTLPLLDIPDDPQAWPAWLEGHLVGAELGALVDELTATLEPTTDGPPLAEVCGKELPKVLQRGLSALSATQVRLLLKLRSDSSTCRNASCARAGVTGMRNSTPRSLRMRLRSNGGRFNRG